MPDIIEDKENKVVSELEEIEEEANKDVAEAKHVPPKKDKKSKVGKPKKVTITFRANRRFELQVDRTFMVFMGRESKEVDIDLIEHPDFQNKRKYFSIKGI